MTDIPTAWRDVLDGAGRLSGYPSIDAAVRAANIGLAAHQPDGERCAACSQPPIEVAWPCGLLGELVRQVRSAMASAAN